MAAAKLTAQQQRDRRAKIMLGVLGVLLVGVLALQLPKLLHSGGSTPAAPPPVTTAATAAALVSAPAPAQLQHFSRFAPKDPFRSQVATTSTTSTSMSPAAPVVKPKQPKPTSQPPLTISVAQQPASLAPRVPAALLLVAGKRRVVPLNGLFPAKHPVFRLVALSEKALWIQLIGGSLANGTRTVRLDLGRRVTLKNTTAGPKIVLVPVRLTAAPKVLVAGATSGTPAG